MNKMTINACITQLSKICNVYEIELIIAHVLKKDRVFVISHASDIITKEQKKEIVSMCTDRTRHIPLAYILGYREFYSRNFIVTIDTLIPRPETEILIESVLSFIHKHNPKNLLIVDVGTGSGIIPITLHKELTNNNLPKQIIASDISNDALLIAKKNNQKHHTNNILFCHADLLDNTLQQKILAINYDNIIITANLPYVDIAIQKDLLQNEESKSLEYEPPIALWSNDNGLYHYKKLINQTLHLSDLSTNNAQITSFYEIDPKQLALLKHYLNNNTTSVSCFRDLTKKDRIIQWSC